jgi:DNA-binding MarR family transcriptional regulator
MLVEAGLVERVPDPADRRVRGVVVIDARARLSVSCEECVTGIEADPLSGLPEVEAQFLVVLVAARTLTHEPPALHLQGVWVTPLG